MEKFRRENRNCFGDKRKCFGINHHTGNVPESVQDNFRGCQKCSGTFRNFSEEIVAENILSQREGTRSHETWGLFLGCFGGAPLRGTAPLWLDKVLGPPHGGGQ